MIESKMVSEEKNDLEGVLFLFRKEVLEQEAEEHGSKIQCPNCQTHLPNRAPFFGWDNKAEKPSYYCTLCDYEF